MASWSWPLGPLTVTRFLSVTSNVTPSATGMGSFPIRDMGVWDVRPPARRLAFVESG